MSEPKRRSQAEWIKYLNGRGFTDRDIAIYLSTTEEKIFALRHGMGLPLAGQFTLAAHVRQLHADGFDDIEIARRTREPRKMIAFIRGVKLGLTARNHSRDHDDETFDERFANVDRFGLAYDLRADGFSVEQIAERLAVPVEDVEAILKTMPKTWRAMGRDKDSFHSRRGPHMYAGSRRGGGRKRVPE